MSKYKISYSSYTRKFSEDYNSCLNNLEFNKDSYSIEDYNYLKKMLEDYKDTYFKLNDIICRYYYELDQLNKNSEGKLLLIINHFNEFIVTLITVLISLKFENILLRRIDHSINYVNIALIGLANTYVLTRLDKKTYNDKQVNLYLNKKEKTENKLKELIELIDQLNVDLEIMNNLIADRTIMNYNFNSNKKDKVKKYIME